MDMPELSAQNCLRVLAGWVLVYTGRETSTVWTCSTLRASRRQAKIHLERLAKEDFWDALEGVSRDHFEVRLTYPVWKNSCQGYLAIMAKPGRTFYVPRKAFRLFFKWYGFEEVNECYPMNTMQDYSACSPIGRPLIR